MNDRDAKFAAAQLATAAVVTGFNEATDALSTCYVNSVGILSDRSATIARLGNARAAIDKALAAIRECEDWPSASDYDDD
jgi:hypothetical protein